MKKRLIAVAVVAAIALAGCSDDDPDTSSTDEDTTEDAGTTDDSTSSGDEAGGDSVVATADTDAGEVLVDEAGLSLYGFTEDADGEPTCTDACADAWPPLLVDSADLPEGLDAEVFSVAERPDGTFQLVAGSSPLYRFAGDATAGDINGQGSGDVWFLAAPDGSLITDDAAAAEESSDTTSDYGY
jgi:predicted lipoprotein with Yx(FWY)xxD motif